MRVAAAADEVRAAAKAWCRESKTIALVATMGGLHAGHAALMASARALADRVVASVFVNQLQFDRADDYERYPRTAESDLALLRECGVDLAFTPAADAMFPPAGGQIVFVDPGPLARDLCGAHRAGHFRGMATVVVKLFAVCAPDIALFGEKDLSLIHI